ncbi:hypothetical protein CR513_63103, partial [Mucuna pruriens]
MKYPIKKEVGVIWADQKVARKCYEDILRVGPRSSGGRGATINFLDLDLDPREQFEDQRPCPAEELKERGKLGEEKKKAPKEETNTLLAVGFIKEVQYPTWLANMVMVRKPSGRWRMCMDYTDLNKASPKDPYPFPNIDQLVDGASGFALLSFMDAYSRYNQIRMHPQDESKIVFIINLGTFFYKLMPFGLKDAYATYQHLMDRIFEDVMGTDVEAYIDDMMVKLTTVGEHYSALQRLARRITALSRFLSRSAKVALLIFYTLMKGGNFVWTVESEEAFQKMKAMLAAHVLTKPIPGTPLLVYLFVTNNVIKAAIVQEKEGNQCPVYFISSVLQGLEKRYQKIEKATLALIFDISFERSGHIKAQALVNFITKLAPIGYSSSGGREWFLFVDGASNQCGIGVGVILEGLDRVLVEQSLWFKFKANNNQAEYEVLLAEMKLVKELDAQILTTKSDSKLVTSQNRLADGGRTKGVLCGDKEDVDGPIFGILQEGCCSKRHNLGQKVNERGIQIHYHYFTKLVEAELVTTISAKRVKRFYWKMLICRFGLLDVIVLDNGTQFSSQSVAEFCSQLKIQQSFTSVEHP